MYATMLQQVCHFKVDVIAGEPTPHHTSAKKRQKHQDMHGSSVAIMLREMQREVNTGHSFERRLHIDYSTCNHPPAIWLSFHGESQPDPEFMRKLWSNLKPNHAVNFREHLADVRERTDYPGRGTEDISRERGIESQLRAAQRAHRDQEDATDPMVAPQDYDDRQSGRVLGLRSDLWLRPTSLSWPVPILMTIVRNRSRNRCRNHLGRTNDLGILSWRQWSSDETRARSDWQPSADWNSSDQTHDRSEWRSSGSWQSPFSWQ